MSKTKRIFNIAVIGGGASGMMSAISAAREAEKSNVPVCVTIYEANNRIGKKLLVTGNGRCNFSNEYVTCDNFHGNAEEAFHIYKKFNNKSVCDFFNEIGIIPKSDAAGRIYPLSFQASSLLDALRFETEKLNITTVCDTKITSVSVVDNSFILNNTFSADACIVATGGKASPVHGSDGSGYELIRPYKIDIIPVLPALSALVCENYPKGLKGVRAQGTIQIKASGKLLAQDTGEIQFTDYGLSGIPSMQVSGEVSRALYTEKSPVFAILDLCPSLSSEQLSDYLFSLVKFNPLLPAENLLAGIMPKKLGVNIICDCSVNPQKNIGILHKGVIEKIVSVTKARKFRINSVRGFSDSQVSCGGISFNEIRCDTMELKKVSHLYVCGEIVNVDGDCGGYNLQWAWSSGYVAGINSIRELIKCYG